MSKIYGELKRVILTGTAYEEISFTKPSEKFLIKNFTSGDIYVSSVSAATDDISAKIPKDYGQVFEVPVWSTSQEGGNTFIPEAINKLYLKGTGEVEVMQLCFH